MSLTTREVVTHIVENKNMLFGGRGECKQLLKMLRNYSYRSDVRFAQLKIATDIVCNFITRMTTMSYLTTHEKNNIKNMLDHIDREIEKAIGDTMSKKIYSIWVCLLILWRMAKVVNDLYSDEYAGKRNELLRAIINFGIMWMDSHKRVIGANDGWEGVIEKYRANSMINIHSPDSGIKKWWRRANPDISDVDDAIDSITLAFTTIVGIASTSVTVTGLIAAAV